MSATHAPPLTYYFARSALLEHGWSRDVTIGVAADGFIRSITTEQRPGAGAESCQGTMIPAMANLHSHAFQRAMAGSTERAGPQGDSFWGWREQMYRFIDLLTPDDVEAIAAMLYVEMLEAGYSAVAEFHYLHHAPSGASYDDIAEMGQRIIQAARSTGIGLTLLPVFYHYSGFGAKPASHAQRRFVNQVDQFQQLVEALKDKLAPGMRLGIAPHSLRAADGADLKQLRAGFARLAPDTPWHIHAAEQQKEVAESIAATGARPIQWLLDEIGLDATWCVVHATHMDEKETLALAQSGAVAGLCPSTEADLGDGLFNASAYFVARGAFGLGSDSHVLIDPFAELRLLEYGQRLVKQKRNLSGAAIGESVGANLYRQAAAGGAKAVAQPTGRLAVGHRADWVILNNEDASLCARKEDDLLDAAIFAPRGAPIRDVMVNGTWQVRDGVHRARSEVALAYRACMKRLLGAAR